MSPEDKRAAGVQGVLQNAQKQLAEMVKSGDIDPMDAQEVAVGNAIQDFMAMGDYQSAQALVPQLNQVRQYKAELGKLYSETAENQADQVNALSQAGKYQTEAGAIETKLPFETANLSAQAGANEALARQRDADARLKDRTTDPNRAKGSDPASLSAIVDKYGKAELAKAREAQSATLGGFSALHELSLHMDQHPEVASLAGKGVAGAGQYVVGAMNFLQRKGTAEANVYDKLTDEQKELAQKGRAQRALNAKKMGLLQGVNTYNSLVIDTAYAMARAMDPGGRLSNNDFAFALEALGAVQDAESAKAAFAAIEARMYRRHKDRMIPYGSDAEVLFPALSEIESRHAEFEKRWGGSRVLERDAKNQMPAKVECTEGRRKYGLCK
jgi:hypothetical protein